ncbi:MAG: hypothetical protein WAR38_09775, partial [Chitinophagaceae bacterium]
HYRAERKNDNSEKDHSYRTQGWKSYKGQSEETLKLKNKTFFHKDTSWCPFLLIKSPVRVINGF